jgi:hypothetical protein
MHEERWMNRGFLLLLVALLWIVSPLAAQTQGPPDRPAEPGLPADPENPPEGFQTVFIKLVSKGAGAREIVLGPQAVTACKGGKGCADHFKMRWIGSRNDSETIHVVFEEGADVCFDPADFTLYDTGVKNEQTVTVRSDNPDCKSKAFFSYDVSCVGGEGGDCGGVETFDPGAMVGGGGN